MTALQLESVTRAEDAAGEFEIGCLGEDGIERRLPLGEVWATLFEDGLPVRRFASRTGQRHLSGLWWSATMGRHVGFDARHPGDHLGKPHHNGSSLRPHAERVQPLLAVSS